LSLASPLRTKITQADLLFKSDLNGRESTRTGTLLLRMTFIG